mmetsp:Transcript_18279/g.53718  ORF Transcript_18279/g.53718 Transcript_18279/m.53718 type:complete len:216 (-) Transcript_18279:92-739(-)
MCALCRRLCRRRTLVAARAAAATAMVSVAAGAEGAAESGPAKAVVAKAARRAVAARTALAVLGVAVLGVAVQRTEALMTRSRLSQTGTILRLGSRDSLCLSSSSGAGFPTLHALHGWHRMRVSKALEGPRDDSFTHDASIIGDSAPHGVRGVQLDSAGCAAGLWMPIAKRQGGGSGISEGGSRSAAASDAGRGGTDRRRPMREAQSKLGPGRYVE